MISFQQAFGQKAKFYIGSQEKNAGAAISLCELDLSNGNVTLLDTNGAVPAPGYLALSPDKKFLYAVSSNNTINAFKINSDSKLSWLNSASSEGMNPCHISVHPSGKLAFASNYTGGSFNAYPILGDGKLAPSSYHEQYNGSGPNTARQEKSHAHFAQATPNGRYVYAVDLGADKVMNYQVDVKTGKLTPNPSQPFFTAKPGTGPRHFVIHSSGKWLFLLNELSATLSVCSIDKNGVITEVGSYATVPADFTAANTSAAIHMHPNNNFVYVSNRGHNSVSAFKILADGKLEKVSEATQGVATPRDFNIDPSGKFMVIANQSTDNLVIYDVDAKTGKLTFRSKSIESRLPICIVFL